MDDNNVIYIGGATASPDFPTTSGAYDTSYNSSGNNGFVAKLQILSPQDKIRFIIDKINELVTNGGLCCVHANGLIAKLNGVIDKIDKGNNNPAINQLNAFINQVNGFINAGKLSTTDGQELIDDANDVINEL